MNHIDAKLLEQSLQQQYEILLPQWLPGGKINSYRNEYVCDSIFGGEGDSFGINLETFLFNDLNGDAKSKGKGLISLYMAQRSVDFKTAINELSGYADNSPIPVTKPKKPVRIEEPKFYQEPQKTLNGKNHNGLWYYFDDFNEPIYCVVRFNKEYNPKKGKHDKTFRQWTKTENGWISKGPKGNRPLYNKRIIKENPDAQIVLVEGEKCADALNKIFNPQKTIAISWMGGSDAVSKADWSPLKDRNVVFWPDADEAGASTKIPMLKFLTPIVNTLKVLDAPVGDNDAADMDFQSMSEFISYAKKYVKQIKPYPQEIIETKDAPKTSLNVSVNNADRAPSSSEDLKHMDLKFGYPHMRIDSKGNPIGPVATLENFKVLLEKLGIKVRYNVIRKTGDILIPNKSFLIDTERIAKLAHVLSYMAQANMPQTNYADFLEAIAAENLYNPIAEWIESRPWDGVSRLNDLYDTVTVDTHLEDNKKLYMRKWLISAVAAAYSYTGVTVRGILVFQGSQSLGKTYWFTRLLPSEMKDNLLIGHSLAPQDKDNVQKTVSHWMVELGELDATFKKADISRLKAFISDYKDSLRPAFIKERAEYARRTVFFASVNPDKFLNDPTGSSRFWTIKVKHLNNNHNIDMQQLWAEVKTIYDSGETWHLNPEQILALEVNNADSQSGDEFVDILQTYFDFSDGWETRERKCFSATEIAIACGLKPDPKILRQIGEAALKLTKGLDQSKANGRTTHKMPKYKSFNTELLSII